MQKRIEEMTNDEILNIFDEYETDEQLTAEVFRRFKYYVLTGKVQGSNNAETTYKQSECER